MTIVIALSCSDGVVMASDSQAAETHAAVRYDVPKVFELTSHAVWGGSGDSQTIRDVNDALQQARGRIEASATLSQDLVDTIRPVLEQRYRNVIQLEGNADAIPWTDSLACGYDPSGGGSWIVEVDRTCNTTHYEDRGFHAIGVPAGLASLGNALLAHVRPAEKPLMHGQLLAYRVMDAAIQTSGFGVGGPIQMWCVDAAGVRQVDSDELLVMRGLAGAWQEDERTSLDRIAGAPGLEPEPAPLPPPAGQPEAPGHR
jgi:proteasome beta subunit